MKIIDNDLKTARNLRRKWPDVADDINSNFDELSESISGSGESSAVRQLYSFGNVTPVQGSLVSVTLGTATPTLTGDAISKDSDFITYLGGNRVGTYGPNSPQNQFNSASNLTEENGDNEAIGAIVEFKTDATSFEYKSYGQGIGLRIIINGEFKAEFNGHNPDGSIKYVLVDMTGLDRVKEVRMEFYSKSPFGGLVLNTGAKMYYPRNTGRKMVIAGDSFTEGTGVGSTTELSDGWAAVCAKRLGFNDYAMSGFGGTGYLKANATGGGRPALINRVVEDVYGYEVVIIAMGINDDEADISEQIKGIYNSVLSQDKNVQLIVLGAWGDGAGLTNKPLIEQSIVGATSQVSGALYLQVYDIPFTKSDATHPDQAGHIALGTEISNRLATLLK